MADNETQTDGDAVAEMRGTLTRRLIVAAALVAILLGVLALFDHLGKETEMPEAPVFSEPVPVAPKKEVSQPLTPTGETPATPAPEAAAEETPPPPEVEARPAIAAPTTAAPARSGQIVQHPAPARTQPPAPPPVAEETAPPLPLAPTPPEASAKPLAAPRLAAGFVLQAGVFASPQLAEELHAKLTLSGVPSIIETRVQVGPFRTRHEAEAAQARLREAGIQTLLVAPPKKR